MVCMEEFECLEERFVEVDTGVGFRVEAFEACEEEADEFETGEGFAGEGSTRRWVRRARP